MASDDQGPVTGAQEAELQRRRRPRRMLAYGGLGGGVTAALVAIYFLVFSVVIYRDLEKALQEIERRHPSAPLKIRAVAAALGLSSDLRELCQPSREEIRSFPITRSCEFSSA